MRARQTAAHWNTRAAYSTYLPSLSFSAGYGKFSQTTTENSIDSTTTPPTALSLKSKTSGTSPWNLRLGISLPLFDAFQRNTQISQARADEANMQQGIRARELQVRADVSAAYLALLTAYRTIAVQDNNRTAADEALSLATQRYRVGSGSIIELLDARVTSEKAGFDYISAVYNYHKAIAALEQAVGQPLR